MESVSPGTRYFPDFGWIPVGKGVELPYITRPPDFKFVPVKLIDRLILRHYPSTYPKELAEKPPLICQFLNRDEANILSGLCERRYRTSHLVGTHDPIVNLIEFQVFFNIVQKTYPDVQIAECAATEPQTPPSGPSTTKQKKSRTEHVPHGWMLIKDAMIPFVERGESFLLPLNVLQGAAQLLTNVSVNVIPSVRAEVDCLNRLCKTAKMTFIFEKKTALVDLTTVLMHNPNCPVRPLPSNDPLSGLVPGPDSIKAMSTSECLMIPPALAAMYNLPPPPPLVPLDKIFPNYNMNASPTIAKNEVLTPGIPEIIRERELAPPTSSGVDRTPQPQMENIKPIEHITELQNKYLAPNEFPTQINSNVGPNLRPLPEPVKILPIECFGKTISCITRGKLKTKYALVEAVCRVFFTECNLVDFVNYLEHDLSVKLHSLKKAEEATFINFFGIPTDKLCCNLLIKLKDFVDRMAWLKEQFGDISPAETDAVVPSGVQETRNDTINDTPPVPFNDTPPVPFPKKRKASKSVVSGAGEGTMVDQGQSELEQLRLAIKKLKSDQQQQLQEQKQQLQEQQQQQMKEQQQQLQEQQQQQQQQQMKEQQQQPQEQQQQQQQQLMKEQQQQLQEQQQQHLLKEQQQLREQQQQQLLREQQKQLQKQQQQQMVKEQKLLKEHHHQLQEQQQQLLLKEQQHQLQEQQQLLKEQHQLKEQQQLLKEQHQLQEQQQLLKEQHQLQEQQQQLQEKQKQAMEQKLILPPFGRMLAIT